MKFISHKLAMGKTSNSSPCGYKSHLNEKNPFSKCKSVLLLPEPLVYYVQESITGVNDSKDKLPLTTAVKDLSTFSNIKDFIDNFQVKLFNSTSHLSYFCSIIHFYSLNVELYFIEGGWSLLTLWRSSHTQATQLCHCKSSDFLCVGHRSTARSLCPHT